MTPHALLCREAGKIFGKEARPARLVIEGPDLVALAGLRARIRDFGAVDGWLAFVSSTGVFTDLDFADDGRIAEVHGAILAAELSDGETAGMMIEHVGDGQAQVTVLREDATADDALEVIAVARRLVGQPPLAWLHYLEYWRVPDGDAQDGDTQDGQDGDTQDGEDGSLAGAASAVTARLVRTERQGKGEGG